MKSIEQFQVYSGHEGCVYYVQIMISGIAPYIVTTSVILDNSIKSNLACASCLKDFIIII